MIIIIIIIIVMTPFYCILKFNKLCDVVFEDISETATVYDIKYICGFIYLVADATFTTTFYGCSFT